MTNLTYKAVEDNAGGLHLYVFDADTCVFAAHGYERHNDEAQQLAASIDLIDRGHGVADLPRGRVHGIDAADDPAEDWADMETFVDDGRSKVIADEGGIYVNRMGAAGLREFPANISLI